MLLWLVLLNIVLSIMNGVNAVEGQNLFNIWVSGFNAAGAFTLFLMWFFDRELGKINVHELRKQRN